MIARAAVVGIGYQLWTRTRWVLLTTVALVAACAAAVDDLRSPLIAMLIGNGAFLLLVVTAPAFIQACLYGGDLSGSESSFPRHMMTLPLSAAALALTPLLYGIAFVTMLVYATHRFVLVPIGWPVPPGWSLLLPAAGLAWLAALSWTPFWLPLGRLIACVVVLGALAASVVVAQGLAAPPWITCAGLLAATLLGIALAVRGVGRSRRGEGTVRPWASIGTARADASRRRKPFASAERAQIWFELRRNATMPALFVLSMIGFTLPLLFVRSQRVDLVDFYLTPVPFLTTAVFLVMPAFALALVGGNFAKPDAWSEDPAAPAFLAARPTTDRFLVSAKLKAAALTVAALWLIALLAVAVKLCLPAAEPRHETLAHLLSRHVPATLGAVAGLVALSCVNVVKSFAPNLYGRRWIGGARVIATVVLLAILGPLGFWVARHPEWHATASRAARVLLYTLVAAKLTAAVPLLRALRRCRVATARELVTWTAGWVAAAAALAGLARWLPSVARPSGAPLLAAVVLLLPYNRLLAMPLAWHLNRHR